MPVWEDAASHFSNRGTQVLAEPWFQGGKVQSQHLLPLGKIHRGSGSRRRLHLFWIGVGSHVVLGLSRRQQSLGWCIRCTRRSRGVRRRLTTRGVDSTSAGISQVKPRLNPLRRREEGEGGGGGVCSPGQRQGKESGYGQLVVRANKKAEDKADIQYAVKEVCRGMASPTGDHWRQVKRFGRYLKGRPLAVAKSSRGSKNHLAHCPVHEAQSSTEETSWLPQVGLAANASGWCT